MWPAHGPVGWSDRLLFRRGICQVGLDNARVVSRCKVANDGQWPPLLLSSWPGVRVHQTGRSRPGSDETVKPA
jgi:hypothetical protein